MCRALRVQQQREQRKNEPSKTTRRKHTLKLPDTCGVDGPGDHRLEMAVLIASAPAFRNRFSTIRKKILPA